MLIIKCVPIHIANVDLHGESQRDNNIIISDPIQDILNRLCMFGRDRL